MPTLTRQAERVGDQQKVKIPAAPEVEKVPPAPVGTVREAAERAAAVYALDELERHAEVIMQAWEARLTKQTNDYVKQAMAVKRGEGPEIAGPIALPPGFPPYPWWNVILAGPFQPGISPTPSLPPGPYLPHKIIEANEPAFMVGAIWRNPAGIDWNGTNPSASTVMGAFDLTIWLENVNLTAVANGPDFGPLVFSPLGTSFLTLFWQPINFPAPPQGKPHLYEMNLIADVSGPIAGLPFAGYSTWVYNPDLEPPIFPPPLMPGMGPHWQYDIPARFLVYTA